MASAKTLRTIVAGFIVFLFFYLAVIPTGSSKKKKVIEEHPTQEENNVKTKKTCPEEMYTMDDVKKHTKCSLKDTKNNDLWLVIDDKVYDVTPWSMYF